jgi:light-harvesting complex I chlorophyll a/b binding protein 4
MQEVQTKEIKNGRLAMVAFVGFIIQAQATGQVLPSPFLIA